jgi:glycosyltransferase involved in cell wall biosynthesis
VGRLAPEKNLSYLAEAVALFIKRTPDSLFLVVGGGPSEEKLKEIFMSHGVSDRLVLAGKQTGRALTDAYNSMDVFVFASFSETQGMVLAEAMAAGLPVVALNASGVREVMDDRVNGFMLEKAASARRFADHIAKLHADPKRLKAFSAEARKTAQLFSREHCANLALDFYDDVRRLTRRERLMIERSPWGTLLERIGVEWNLLAEKAQSVVQAVGGR